MDTCQQKGETKNAAGSCETLNGKVEELMKGIKESCGLGLNETRGTGTQQRCGAGERFVKIAGMCDSGQNITYLSTVYWTVHHCNS